MKPSQISTIRFDEDSIVIYENGYFENFKSFGMYNYLAYRECIGNLVPLGYIPNAPLK